MRVADPRFEPAREGFIGKNGVEEDGKLWGDDGVSFGRNGRMEVSQRLVIGEH